MNPITAPLFALLSGIVAHTPAWVWGVLIALLLLGARQLRDHRMSRTRLMPMPLAMGALSISGAASAFGPHLAVALAWGCGAVASLFAGQLLRWPRGVRYDAAAAQFLLRGSAWPMVLMLGVFTVRYAIGASLALHPEWAGRAAVAMTASALYGGLTGLFIARTVTILRHGEARATLQAA